MYLIYNRSRFLLYVNNSVYGEKLFYFNLQKLYRRKFLGEKLYQISSTCKIYYNAAAAADAAGDDLKIHINMYLYITPFWTIIFKLENAYALLAQSMCLINICCSTIDTVTIEQKSVIAFWNYYWLLELIDCANWNKSQMGLLT